MGLTGLGDASADDQRAGAGAGTGADGVKGDVLPACATSEIPPTAAPEGVRGWLSGREGSGGSFTDTERMWDGVACEGC